MTSTRAILTELRDYLLAHDVRGINEDAMQRKVLDVLAAWPRRLPIVREHRLSKKERLDFAVRNAVELLAIECKVKGSFAQVLSQCARYLVHDCIGGLLLVTTRHGHLALPEEFNGKPIVVGWVNARL
jgi:hypothetical protein